MRILMAVDGSAYTIKAADFLATHMDWFKGKPELHLLNVRLPLPPGRVQAVLGKEVIEDYYRDEAEAALEPAERILRAHAISFDSAFAVGDIAGEIQAHAVKWQIDMIVMGSHGHGALKNLVMGSVATKILAGSSIPVLIVR